MEINNQHKILIVKNILFRVACMDLHCKSALSQTDFMISHLAANEGTSTITLSKMNNQCMQTSLSDAL